MGVPRTAQITADEFRDLPEGPPYYQLVEGELFMSPSPERFHQNIILNLAVILRHYLAEHRIGKVYVAPLDVYLTELNVFEPDLVFVSQERAGILGRWIEGAPDFVAEVLSPSTIRLDRRKAKIYAGSGVEEMWLLDPIEKRIEQYLLQKDAQKAEQVFGMDDEIASTCFPGLSIKVSEIFAE